MVAVGIISAIIVLGYILESVSLDMFKITV